MSINITISIVIRTYGPESTGTILKAIDEQIATNYFINEIVVVNGHANYSFSISIYEGRNKIIFITNPRTPYKPGQALNTGIQHTTGEVIVFLSGHSLPANEQWLGSLVSSISERNVAGVCGAQRPLPQSNWLERSYRGFWYGSNTLGRIFQHFNLANAAIRRHFWELQQFNETLDGCEDRHWARVIRARYGANFKFNSKAVVFHSHIESLLETVRYFVWLCRTFARACGLSEKNDGGSMTQISSNETHLPTRLE